MKYSIKIMKSTFNGEPIDLYGIFVQPDDGEEYQVTPDVFDSLESAQAFADESGYTIE